MAAYLSRGLVLKKDVIMIWKELLLMQFPVAPWQRGAYNGVKIP